MQETPQQYTERILAFVEGKDPLRIQRSTAKKLTAMVKGLDRRLVVKPPAPGKWSIAEILAHLADTELVAGWRMRSILGQNGQPLQAFDHFNGFVMAVQRQLHRLPCTNHGADVDGLDAADQCDRHQLRRGLKPQRWRDLTLRA